MLLFGSLSFFLLSEPSLKSFQRAGSLAPAACLHGKEEKSLGVVLLLVAVVDPEDRRLQTSIHPSFPFIFPHFNSRRGEKESRRKNILFWSFAHVLLVVVCDMWDILLRFKTIHVSLLVDMY